MTGKKGIDPAKYEEGKKEFKDRLLKQRQMSVFGDWLDSLRKKAKIKELVSVTNLSG